MNAKIVRQIDPETLKSRMSKPERKTNGFSEGRDPQLRDHIPQTHHQVSIPVLGFPTSGLPLSCSILGSRRVQDMSRQTRDALIIAWSEKHPMAHMSDKPHLIPHERRIAYFALNETGTKWEYIGEHIRKW